MVPSRYIADMHVYISLPRLVDIAMLGTISSKIMHKKVFHKSYSNDDNDRKV